MQLATVADEPAAADRGARARYSSLREEFDERGFISPVDLLTPLQASLVARHFDDRPRIPGLRWHKGLAATDRLVFEIATRPDLLAMLRELIGPDVVLWGASVVDREPGEAHPWHCDIETIAPDARTVTVWIGLDNTTADACLEVVPGSHRFATTLQQAAIDIGLPREDRRAETILGLARQYSPTAALETAVVQDGQAVLFHGALWHGSLNLRTAGRRRALLLQYAEAGTPIRIPDWKHLDPPFKYRDDVRPPVLQVAGTPASLTHDLVPPPARCYEAPVPLYPQIRELAAPMPGDRRRGWRPHRLFRGISPVLDELGAHVSVLEPGRSPHRPHAHLDEEILVVLDGRAEIVIADASDDPSPRIETLERGDWIYYPAYQHHTIRCATKQPVTYLMFRWHGVPRPDDERRLGMTIVRSGEYTPPTLPPRTIKTSLVFEGPTAHCDLLHAHRTRVTRGGGYEPHDDEHDVAIVLLSGKVRTLGRTVRAPAVLYYPAGVDHGLRGAGSSPADYLVFEFHRAREPAQGDATLSHSRQRLQDELRYRLRHLRNLIEGRLQAVAR